MPLATATVTFDLSDHFGNDYDRRRGIRGWVDTNIPSDTVIDTDGNKIRVGSGKVTFNTDGTGSFTVWVPGVGSNPASWQTYFHVEYVDTGNHAKGRTTRTFGPFTVTGNTDLADLVAEQEVPPEYAGALVAQMGALRDEAQAARDAAVDISGISTSDAVIANRIQTPGSATETALSATFATVVTPEKFGAVGDGVADDTAALTAMLAAVTNRTTIQTKGTYKFTSALSLSNKSDIRWQGPGSLTFAATSASTSGAVKALTFTNINGLDIDGLALTVTTQNREYEGINISGGSRVLLRRVKVYNARWTGISVTGVAAVLEDCEALRCRFGAYLSGTGWKIKGGRYSSEWTQTAEYVTKAGVWDSTSLYYDGIIVSSSTDWSIVGATLDDNGQSGIYGGGGNRRGVIQGCNIFGNFNKGIDLGATGTKSTSNSLSHMSITGNVLRDNSTGDIHVRHCDQSSIVGNVVIRTGAADAFQGIILNGQSLQNSILSNTGSIANPAVAAVFINNADGATGNVLWNQITATTPYTVNTATNTVIDSVAGLKFLTALTQGPVVDLTGKPAGVTGREVLRGQAGTDTYYQLTVDKQLNIQNAGGTTQALKAGSLTGDTGLTVGSGVAFFGDGVRLRLPRTASTNTGEVWYDAASGTLKYRDGVANVTRTITAT